MYFNIFIIKCFVNFQIHRVLNVKTLQIHLDMKVISMTFIQQLYLNFLLHFFYLTYVHTGAIYPCFYSRKNKTVVMTAFNRDTQVNIIIHFFVVPFIITVISSVGICLIHCSCNCKKERPKYRRPRIDNLRWAFFSYSTWIFCGFSFCWHFMHIFVVIDIVIPWFWQ